MVEVDGLHACSSQRAASLGDRVKISDPAEIQNMVRFNEAIDQALTESVARYSEILRESQNLFLAILGHGVLTPLGAISMGAQFLLLDENCPSNLLKWPRAS
jgi:signal transduction histidine kinase